MANELHGIIFGNVHSASGGYFEPACQGEESFLRDVVSPIYQVMRKVLVFSTIFLSLIYIIHYIRVSSLYACKVPFINMADTGIPFCDIRKFKETKWVLLVIPNGETMMI